MNYRIYFVNEWFIKFIFANIGFTDFQSLFHSFIKEEFIQKNYLQ